MTLSDWRAVTEPLGRRRTFSAPRGSAAVSRREFSCVPVCSCAFLCVSLRVPVCVWLLSFARVIVCRCVCVWVASFVEITSCTLMTVDRDGPAWTYARLAKLEELNSLSERECAGRQPGHYHAHTRH